MVRRQLHEQECNWIRLLTSDDPSYRTLKLASNDRALLTMVVANNTNIAREVLPTRGHEANTGYTTMRTLSMYAHKTGFIPYLKLLCTHTVCHGSRK